MTLPTRLVATLGVSTTLLLAGCTPGTPENASTESSVSASPSDAATDPAAAPETGGTCDVTVGEASDAAPAVDEAASKEALGTATLSNDASTAPTVAFEAPLAVTSEVIQITDKGSGDAIADGNLISFNYLVCDMVTGEKMYSTWGTTPDADAPETYTLSADTFGEALPAALDGATVGSRLLWGQPGVAAEESYTGEALNGYLYVLTVTDTQKVLESAEGTEVKPSDDALPGIEFKDGKPAVSVPSSFKDPEELIVQPLIEGEGDVVEAGQTVMVKYTGWLTDGTQFDSSWDREAPDNVFSFQAGAGGVIEGWDQGVVGQKVGSRLLLVVPSDLGYGPDGSGETIPGDSTLIFVVDILAAY
ncbi:FKBP-type peptidyl-prolyl cis-trans isomerase [Tessaracoccus caeni]|uniref:FKBP-type peptidyl-prolyl cis-trans isomerase n=1 Tax=Tessaracoccus caeni TaxID=3031239 RepID=UPI0023DB7CFA|nr:FKBP-type peptidyl-prolyl cis-trans isomerase [Tessaracoccus caeni]MDF1488183.1 FKBP-type peptidyl-prolyl cis-trans isomerase [Tessaracoccus caeni]